jgi:hypothetical protein
MMTEGRKTGTKRLRNLAGADYGDRFAACSVRTRVASA